MKKLLLVLIIVLMSKPLSGQTKINLSKVERIIKIENPTLDQLKEAASIVDNGIFNEKYMSKSKVWYLRGKVYHHMYLSSYYSESENRSALGVISSSYRKAIELGEDTEPYAIFATQELENVWGGLLNNGVNSYQNNDFKNAIKYFEYTSIIKPEDTIGYIYAASAAQENRDYEAAVKNYKSLVKVVPSEAKYATLIALQKDGLRDIDAAQQTISEAKQILGNDNTLIAKYEIDILIDQGKTEEAIQAIQNSIATDPRNHLFHLKKGLLYDQLITNEKRKSTPNTTLISQYEENALDAYITTTALNPKSVIAYFNHSVLLSTRANVFYQEANNLSLQEYKERGKELENKGKTIMKEALIPMEKAYELEPEDADILYALQSFYTRLGYDEKLKQVIDKMKALGLN